LFLPSASVSGAANETKNESSMGGGRQSTARGMGRGRARWSGTTRGGLAHWFSLRMCGFSLGDI
jgi:hypothetical protein